MTNNAGAIVLIVHFMMTIVSLQAINLLAASTSRAASRTGWLVVLSENQRGSTSIRRLVNTKTRWRWMQSRANFSSVPNSLLTGKRRSLTWGDRGPTVSEAEPMQAAVWL